MLSDLLLGSELEDPFIHRSENTEEYGMSWDGRRGQWMNIVYRYQFPATPFIRLDDWRRLQKKSQPLFQFKPAARDETLLPAQPIPIPFSSPKPIRQQKSKLTQQSRRSHHQQQQQEPSPLITTSILASDEENEETEAFVEEQETLANVFEAVGEIGDWDEEAFEEFMNSTVNLDVIVSGANQVPDLFQRPLPLNMASLDGVRLYHSETNHQPWISSCPSTPPPPLFGNSANDHRQLLSDLQLNLS